MFIGCLDPEKFKDFELVKRTQLSHNVAKFRFALSTPTSVLGLPIGQHIRCRSGSSDLACLQFFIIRMFIINVINFTSFHSLLGQGKG